MNCLYLTLFFNIVTNIVQTFINSWSQLLYSWVIEVCRLPFERCHDFFLYLIIVVELFSYRDVSLGEERSGNRWARGSVCMEYFNISHLNFYRSAAVTCTEWGCTLLWDRLMPCDKIPLLLFWMILQSRVIVSQYAVALIVVPGGMKSTMRMPIVSQKTDALIFFTEIEVLNFLVLGECILQWLLLGFMSGENPMFHFQSQWSPETSSCA
jgi:hypothetical protein